MEAAKELAADQVWERDGKRRTIVNPEHRGKGKYDRTFVRYTYEEDGHTITSHDTLVEFARWAAGAELVQTALPSPRDKE